MHPRTQLSRKAVIAGMNEQVRVLDAVHPEYHVAKYWETLAETEKAKQIQAFEAGVRKFLEVWL